MHAGYALVSFLTVLLSFASASAQYIIRDSFVGSDFFNGFTWQTMDDPTHGRVNYVDLSTAINSNLSYGTQKNSL